jgi:hypothetical protein
MSTCAVVRGRGCRDRGRSLFDKVSSLEFDGCCNFDTPVHLANSISFSQRLLLSPADQAELMQIWRGKRALKEGGRGLGS